MKKLPKNLETRIITFGFCAALTLVFAADFVSAQTLSHETLKPLMQLKKLDGKRGAAYDIGVNMAFCWYQAKVVQKESKNFGSKLWEEAGKLRNHAIYYADEDAKSINSAITNPTDRLDTEQFLIFVDGLHESNAVGIVIGINSNLRQKLLKINSNLFDAYALGFEAGFAEAVASGGESADRESIAVHLVEAGNIAKKLKIYNAANGSLVTVVDSKDKMSGIYPKIVSLRKWYGDVVAAIK